MSRLTDATDKLKKLGFTDDKIEQLVDAVSLEIEDAVIADAAEKYNDDELKQLKVEISKIKTPDEYNQKLEEIAQKAYGDEYKEKLEDLLAQQLEQAAQDTQDVRETYQKYAAGDPETVKKVKEMEKSPEVKQMLEEMKKAGFDFQAEMTK